MAGHCGHKQVSVATYVLEHCCVEFEDHKGVFKEVKKVLEKRLIDQKFGAFGVEDLLFCGSMKEGSRIKDPRVFHTTVEFDILAISGYTRGNHRTNDRAGSELMEFLKAVAKEVDDEFELVPGEGGYVYLEYKRPRAGTTVLIDLHPAVETALEIYDIPLDGFWRESYVINEIKTFRKSSHHILVFRVLKFARLLMEHRLRYSKYALKTAMLEHIIKHCHHGDSVRRCALHVLDILYEGYKRKSLVNVFTRKNVLERHDGNPTTVKEIDRLQKALKAMFYCVFCLCDEFGFPS